MALRIETFSNASGGNAFYKAVTHPLAARGMAALLERIGTAPVAVYDPDGQGEALAELYDLRRLEIAGCFVQNLDAVGVPLLGHAAEPVTELAHCRAKIVLALAFDAARPLAHIRHLLPSGAEAHSLDAIRLPDRLLSVPGRYLDSLNFATNFVFFREESGLSTRLVTANYWARYGAPATALWCLLFDGRGRALAEWEETLAPGMSGIVLDSRAIRRRFALPEFTGQLFLHAIGAKGHDVVKYALDIYGERDLSATHDANSWPADFYAGLPAPAPGERVTLWVQNSQPCAIPAGAIALNPMGEDEAAAKLDRAIAPFATLALDVASLLPHARWPQQLELQAGKYVVRPRYEIADDAGRRRIAHVNVERTDLRPDPKLAELGNLLGKGYILPAPILPLDAFATTVLPTPMARSERALPLAILVYDRDGRELVRRRLGLVPRRQAAAIEVDSLLEGKPLPGGYGHFELIYDLAEGGEANGWLHALFRWRHRASGHAAESSFGAHVFNTVLTYKGEPQSYSGRAPGLSTRLFLRLGAGDLDTLCHLIYPASTAWHALSATELVLHDGDGTEIAVRAVQIPCSGSLLWRYRDMFDANERSRAGAQGYVVVRDATCRLFGYHGLMRADCGFSFDHMFGF